MTSFILLKSVELDLRHFDRLIYSCNNIKQYLFILAETGNYRNNMFIKHNNCSEFPDI